MWGSKKSVQKGFQMTATLRIENFLSCMPTKELRDISEKIVQGERLTYDEGCYLMKSPETSLVCELANYIRKKRVGDRVYFASTLFIHPTNLCELSCRMCSYYAKPGWKKAWFLTPEQIENKIRNHIQQKLTEIHIVGGLWRECNLDYYQELFTRIKSIDANLHIKALTPVEYDFLARLHGISVEEVFQRMISWGLGSLPGGGAEVLVESVRKKIAPEKISSDEYIHIHRIAHQLGLRSNITMLFGHVEQPQDLVTHLCKVRDLQDETGLVQTFVPLKYHVENNALGRKMQALSEDKTRHVYAVSRIMLDNIRNIKVLWNYIGPKNAQNILNCGANDFSSTALEEQIITMAGGVQVKMDRQTMVQLISEIGREPFEIHSGYDYTAEN